MPKVRPDATTRRASQDGLAESSRRRAGYVVVCICLLVALGVGLRVLFWTAYTPWVCGDTIGYLEAAYSIATGDLSHYVGGRTPAYPAFIALIGFVARAHSLATGYRAVVLAQFALGILVSLLVFGVVRRVTRNTTLALVTAVLNSLAVNWILHEMTILSEPLSSFLIMLSVTVYVTTHSRRPSARGLLALGLVTALAILTRPVNIALVPVYLAATWADRRLPAFRPRAALSGAFVFPPLLFCLLVCAFNYRTTGWFTLSTYSGRQLLAKSGEFIEYAPDEYAAVRDIYVRYRDLRKLEVGNASSANWFAWQALSEATGYDSTELSRYLTRMSLLLIMQHPFLYAKDVVLGWLQFWVPEQFSYVSPDAPPEDPRSPDWTSVVRDDGTQRFLMAVWRVCAPLWTAAFVLLPAAFASLVFGKLAFKTRVHLPEVVPAAAVVALGLATSCGDIMVPRYTSPTQPLLIAALAIAMSSLRPLHWKARK